MTGAPLSPLDIFQQSLGGGLSGPRPNSPLGVFRQATSDEALQRDLEQYMRIIGGVVGAAAKPPEMPLPMDINGMGMLQQSAFAPLENVDPTPQNDLLIANGLRAEASLGRDLDKLPTGQLIARAKALGIANPEQIPEEDLKALILDRRSDLRPESTGMGVGLAASIASLGLGAMRSATELAAQWLGAVPFGKEIVDNVIKHERALESLAQLDEGVRANISDEDQKAASLYSAAGSLLPYFGVGNTIFKGLSVGLAKGITIPAGRVFVGSPIARGIIAGVGTNASFDIGSDRPWLPSADAIAKLGMSPEEAEDWRKQRAEGLLEVSFGNRTMNAAIGGLLGGLAAHWQNSAATRPARSAERQLAVRVEERARSSTADIPEAEWRYADDLDDVVPVGSGQQAQPQSPQSPTINGLRLLGAGDEAGPMIINGVPEGPVAPSGPAAPAPRPQLMGPPNPQAVKDVAELEQELRLLQREKASEQAKWGSTQSIDADIAIVEKSLAGARARTSQRVTRTPEDVAPEIAPLRVQIAMLEDEFAGYVRQDPGLADPDRLAITQTALADKGRTILDQIDSLTNQVMAIARSAGLDKETLPGIWDMIQAKPLKPVTPAAQLAKAYGTVFTNADGSPRVWFHGTGSGFINPDESRADPKGLWGPGFYGTANPVIAGGDPTSIYDQEGGYAGGKAGTLEGARANLKTNIDNIKEQMANFEVQGPASGVTPETYAAYQTQLPIMQQQLDAMPIPAANVRPFFFLAKKVFMAEDTYDLEQGLEVIRQLSTVEFDQNFDWQAVAQEWTAIASRGIKLSGERLADMIATANGEQMVVSMNGNAGSSAREVFGMTRFAQGLKTLGYDAIAHLGGFRTGNSPHDVVVALDYSKILPVYLDETSTAKAAEALGIEMFKENAVLNSTTVHEVAASPSMTDGVVASAIAIDNPGAVFVLKGISDPQELIETLAKRVFGGSIEGASKALRPVMRGDRLDALISTGGQLTDDMVSDYEKYGLYVGMDVVRSSGKIAKVVGLNEDTVITQTPLQAAQSAKRVNRHKHGTVQPTNVSSEVADVPEMYEQFKKFAMNEVADLLFDVQNTDWFRGSKVIDANGKPLTVYHGTTANFDKFSSEFFGTGDGNQDLGPGFYFADEPNVTEAYAEGTGGNVRPVYLSIKNPATNETLQQKAFQDALDDTMGFTSASEFLASQGYDGIIYTHKKHGGLKEYVVFDSSQIRSVFGESDDWWSPVVFERLPALLNEFLDNLGITDSAVRAAIARSFDNSRVTEFRDFIGEDAETAQFMAQAEEINDLVTAIENADTNINIFEHANVRGFTLVPNENRPGFMLMDKQSSEKWLFNDEAAVMAFLNEAPINRLPDMTPAIPEPMEAVPPISGDQNHSSGPIEDEIEDALREDLINEILGEEDAAQMGVGGGGGEPPQPPRPPVPPSGDSGRPPTPRTPSRKELLRAQLNKQPVWEIAREFEKRVFLHYMTPARIWFQALDQAFNNAGVTLAPTWQAFDNLDSGLNIAHTITAPYQERVASAMRLVNRKSLRDGTWWRIYEILDPVDRAIAGTAAGLGQQEIRAMNEVDMALRELTGDVLAPQRLKEFTAKTRTEHVQNRFGDQSYKHTELEAMDFFAHTAASTRMRFERVDPRTVLRQFVRSYGFDKYAREHWDELYKTWQGIRNMEFEGERKLANLADVIIDKLDFVQFGPPPGKDTVVKVVNRVFNLMGVPMTQAESRTVLMGAQDWNYKALLGWDLSVPVRDAIQPLAAGPTVGSNNIGDAYTRALGGFGEEARDAMLARSLKYGVHSPEIPRTEKPTAFEAVPIGESGRFSSSQEARREGAATLGDTVRDVATSFERFLEKYAPPRARQADAKIFTPLGLYNKQGKWHRIIVGEAAYWKFMTEYDKFRAQMTAAVQGNNLGAFPDWKDFARAINVDAMRPAVARSVISKMQAGEIDDAISEYMRAVVNKTQGSFGALHLPMGITTTAGRIAFGFGNFSTNFVQYMNEAVRYGGINHRAKTMALLASLSGLFTVIENETGFLTKKWMWIRGLAFTGSPQLSAWIESFTTGQKVVRAVTSPNVPGSVERDISAALNPGKLAAGIAKRFNPTQGAFDTYRTVENALLSPKPGTALVRGIMTGDSRGAATDYDRIFTDLFLGGSAIPVVPVAAQTDHSVAPTTREPGVNQFRGPQQEAQQEIQRAPWIEDETNLLPMVQQTLGGGKGAQ